MGIISVNAVEYGDLHNASNVDYLTAYNAAVADTLSLPPNNIVPENSTQGGFFIVTRGEITFLPTIPMGNILVSASITIWLVKPAHGSEDDAGQTNLFFVPGVNTGAPVVADFGLLLSSVALWSAAEPYATVTALGNYHTINLNALALSHITPGSLFSVGIRIQGDILGAAPTGRNDVVIQTNPHLTILNLTYAPPTGNSIKKKLFATGTI